jgi:ubiquinone/menaquinone biosynthesis C-methylase UbiE
MSTSKAFEIWEAASETLEQVEARIHDGVSPNELGARAHRYVATIFELFPWFSIAPGNPPVEVGPGVGYIMQAFADVTHAETIIGLDVAAGMINHAKARVIRDRLPAHRFQFKLYDGVHFPWNDGEVGAFFSVAALQHVPKPYAYNILFEMQRCLAPGGCAAIHLMSWAHLRYSDVSIRAEIANQIAGLRCHWHHYWDRIEIDALMRYGVVPQDFHVHDHEDRIWVAWKK